MGGFPEVKSWMCGQNDEIHDVQIKSMSAKVLSYASESFQIQIKSLRNHTKIYSKILYKSTYFKGFFLF